MAEPVPLIVVIDGAEYLIDAAAWVPAGTPLEDRPAVMAAVVQGWLTRSEVVGLPLVGGSSMLTNWRAVELFEVRLP